MKPFIKKEKSSISTMEETSSQRPKRSTCQKNLDGSNGLLWREETDLKKALYASLQETRRRNLDEEEGEDPDDGLKTPPIEVPLNEQDDILKKAKVHAQRKFAQGSNPNSPVPTPLKVPYVNNSATELLPYRRPKTEDFLTFLCLRGTSILPPSLDFLNCCSKSDTSSECRSLSPDLEVKENTNPKETIQKTSESKDKNNSRHEGLLNGVPRKSVTCKASSKRHQESLPPIKKTNLKAQKEVTIIRKRKSRDEIDDIEFVPASTSSSHLKASLNNRTRSSTLHALKEKYKKQRLAADKKKLLPNKTTTTTSQAASTKVLPTRSQSASKQTGKRSMSNPVNKKATKPTSPPFTKLKLSRMDKKLAMEKRKSLRSAHPHKSFGQRKHLGLNKKTMWLRRAKLVPPIVDVDSDSEPEIISSAPPKKTSGTVIATKQGHLSNSGRLSERLRNKVETSKQDTNLTSRQILLRKHMQNRFKAKTSVIHSKNIKSKVIVKKTAKLNILKKVRKTLASKTMSLRKDLQNKRVTRSAKHQIEEMLWSNPEKRPKSQNSKTFTPKCGKKRHSIESTSISKKTKLTLPNKIVEAQQIKHATEKDVKHRSISNKISKQNISLKAIKKVTGNVKNTRSKKSILSSSKPIPKSSCSTTDKETILAKSKIDNSNKLVENRVTKLAETKINNKAEKEVSKQIEGKVGKKYISKGNHSEERKVVDNKLNKQVQNKGHKSVESKVNKMSSENNSKEQNPDHKQKPKSVSSSKENSCSKINVSTSVSKSNNISSVDLKNCSKSLHDKDITSMTKESSLENDNHNDSHFKETNVQNNLNLQKIDKNINKDISKLISLNVECDEPIKSEPGCSGICQEEKIKKINVEKSEKCTTKLENVLNDGVYIKKHSDKKYLKNASFKEDKLNKKSSDKIAKSKTRDTSSNKFKSDKIVTKNTDKGLLKSELNNFKNENSSSSDSLDSCEATPLSVYKNSLNHDKRDHVKLAVEINGGANKDCSSSVKDVLNNTDCDSLKYSNPNNTESSSFKTEHKKDTKKQKSENKDVCDLSIESSNNFKRNCENAKSENSAPKEKNIKKELISNTGVENTSQSISTDSDEDSDYDITLDQYLKLKSNNLIPNSTSFTSSPARNDVTNDLNVSKDSKSGKRETEKDLQKSKKDGESSKRKKEKDSSKNKGHDRSFKKEDKLSRKDAEKSLAKLLKRERSKSSKREEKERLKHKRDGSSSSKSSKREFEKDDSKLNRKETEKDGGPSEKKADAKSEFLEKKEKSSKKESSKVSRSNSCDDTKSPKKKRKFNEFKDIEKIKNLISKSSILNEISGFKEFKRRLSSDKSEFKKRLSKSKKRKKLALLKEKKLSKKLSSKLLRKYSKKKGLKKKNKLKKKELKKEIKINSLSSKTHSKNKKQKHKNKSVHHRRESQEKIKNSDAISHTSVATLNEKNFKPDSLHAFSFPQSIETQYKEQPAPLRSEPVSNNVQTSTSDVIAPPAYIIETVPEVNSPIEAISADIPQRISTDLMFNPSDNYSGVVSSEYTGVFDETFSTGTILLATRDSISQVPLHFIQDIPPPPHKTMADAATNTCEDDLDESDLRSEEMSVGTQTVTPVGSPSPTAEMRSIIPSIPIESPLADNSKCHNLNKTPVKSLLVIESPVMPVPSNSLAPSSINKPVPSIASVKPQIMQNMNCPTPSKTPMKSAVPIFISNQTSPIIPIKNTSPAHINSTTSALTTIKSNAPIQICKLPTLGTPVKSNIPTQANNLTTPVTPAKSKVPAQASNFSTSIIQSKSKTPVQVSDRITSFTPAKSKIPTHANNSTTSVTPMKSKTITNIHFQSSPPKVKKRNTFKKLKTYVDISSSHPESFPLDTARMVAAPVFYPGPEEFNDPLEYINKIRPEAEQYGICKIVPPSTFKPECKVNDDMRFTAHNQHLHKMLYRWGPNIQQTACIKKHLKTQKVKLEQPPLIGGIELDVSKFYHTVQQFGGLQQVIEKKKWHKVADAVHVPKTAQDRVTKLYDAYCKYLVSYELLPLEEKQKLEEEVISDHEKRIRLRSNPNEYEKDDDLDDDENNDCVTKGRSMSLSNFFRIARNTVSMWFKNEPSPEEVEHELWRIVTERQQHVVVHAGNIDSAVTQSGFPTNRSPFAKHPWNLKVLTNNNRSILRSMGPLSGITVPTLHVGMLFSIGSWYRDPHSCPWIEYLHTGASKIWYGIPANGSEKFRNAMMKIMPDYCLNKPLWLSVDTAMVPPDLLVEHGASLSRTIQSSGQFVVIFPKAFTSSICCGYCVSESVYFAPIQWLDAADQAFQDMENSCESPAFALERLLFSIANDPKPQLKILEKILPMIEKIRSQELNLRAQLSELGLKQFEHLPLIEVRDKKKKSKNIAEECEQECDICRTPCYVSMVVYPQEDSVYCLPHALKHVLKKNLKFCKLKYTYNENDLNELVKKVADLVSHLPNHSAKKKSPKKKSSSISEK